MGIETSCDETAVAIIKNGREIAANVVASQIVSQKRFGGVVPEIASRHHVEQITLVIEEALSVAGFKTAQLYAGGGKKREGRVGGFFIWIKSAKKIAFFHRLPGFWGYPN